MTFKDLKRQIRSPTKFTKRLITVLPIIVACTAVSLIILWIIMPPAPKNDIPNWMTMTVEVWIGVFIAASIFILQEKTGHSINRTIKKIDQYHENVRLTSLERINRYLSMAWNSIGIDKDTIAIMEEPQRLNIVENLLRCDYKESVFRMLPYVLGQLQGESDVARQYMDKELQDSIRSIIERIQILYGLSPNFPRVAGYVRVERWNSISEQTLTMIKRTQELVRKTLAAD